MNIGTMGIDNEPGPGDITIYPNPVKDYLIVNTGRYYSMPGYQIKIYKSTGVVVYDNLINEQEYEIDLSAWPGKGVYVLHVLDHNRVIKTVRKIVLQ